MSAFGLQQLRGQEGRAEGGEHQHLTDEGDTTPLSLSFRHTHTRHTLAFVRRREAQEEEQHAHAVLLASLRFGELSLEDWTRAVSIAPSFPPFLLPTRPTQKRLFVFVARPSIIWTDLLAVIRLTSDQCVSSP